jgi:ANTAR domain
MSQARRKTRSFAPEAGTHEARAHEAYARDTRHSEPNGHEEYESSAPEGVEDSVVRRTKDGWRVGGTEVPDLTSAMVLADLLSAELETETFARVSATDASSEAARPVSASRDLAREPSSETSKLRMTIGQLEHALTARIRVEQAIGVLAERHRIQPRQAFEQLRDAARSRGKRVIDIASDVVASATNPLLQLPDELSRPRSTGRHSRPARGVLGSE